MKIKNKIILLTTVVSLLCIATTALAATINGTPDSYLSKLANLQKGDTLILSAGSYEGGFNITDRIGEADAWITITGPSTGSPAIIKGRSCCNTVQFRRSQYIKFQNFTIDGESRYSGINAKDGTSHHITSQLKIIHC